MTAPDLSPARFLGRAAAQHPERLSLVDVGTGRMWSVAQTWLTVRRLTTVLRSLGVGEGTRVALVCANSAWHFLTHIACAWTGAVSVPLSPRLPSALLAELLEGCGAALVLGPTRPVEGLSSGVSTLSFEQLAALVDAATPAEDSPLPSSGRTAALVHTSGSTGRPHPVELTHENLWWASMSFRDGFEYTPGRDVVGVCAPLSHVGGFNGTTMDTVCHGGTLVVMPEFSPEVVLRAVQEHRISMMFLVPVMCHLLLDAQEYVCADLSSWTRPLVGGDRMSPTLHARMRSAGLAPIHVWGMTETGGAGAMCSPEVWAAHEGAIGRPFPHLDLRLVSAAGEILTGAGIVGEVEVSGPGVSTAEAAERGREGWLPTGDLGRYDEGGFVHFETRASRLINTGGELVSPLRVEDALRALPEVRDALVVGVPDERWGQVVGAVIVPAGGNDAGTLPVERHDSVGTAGADADGGAATSTAEKDGPEEWSTSFFSAQLADVLAPWEGPRRIVAVRAIPTTATGKPDPTAALALLQP
ncbi:class I adenylate-forming enzyme family protein [Schaalia sp. 19OD2882]|uniref:class I adenylate-forming enzyme family protein n=1 Tax=Schaalia sp. 19OD2882 TaxID=2794089 RepID=UPI0020A719CC|nr:class I adenylate-forming enzyme family protein [Schaalia sp. 19OD2882]